MNCWACNNAIVGEPPLKCTVQNCDKSYHFACTTTRGIQIDKKTWACQDCRSASKVGGDNSGTPIRSAPSSSNVTVRKPQQSAKASTVTPINDYATEIHLLRKELSKLTGSVAEVLKSVNCFNERFDKIESKLESTNMRLNLLESQKDTEIAELQATICELKLESNMHQQTVLKNDLEIIGIPESRHENLVHSVLVIAKKIGVDLVESDIDGVNRVGPRLGLQDLGNQKIEKPPHRPIAVRLLRKVHRDNLLKAAKSRRNLSTTCIGIDGPPRNIFLNERLTRATRQLFREARERNKSFGFYKHCWINGGRIFVRKVDGSPAINISSHNDLEKRFSPGSHQSQHTSREESGSTQA